MDNANELCQKKIAEIYEKYFSEVKFYFYKYTHEAMKAEDMTQELFIKLMGYDDMIVSETARSFVFTIASRMVVDDARHQAFVRRAAQGYFKTLEDNCFWQESETLECKQIAEMELAKLNTLPTKMAQVYRMTRFEDKSAQELADELHISRRTVEYHLLVSRREIRRTLARAINQ